MNSIFSLQEYQGNLSLNLFQQFNKNLKITFQVATLATPLVGLVFLTISFGQLKTYNTNTSSNVGSNVGSNLGAGGSNTASTMSTTTMGVRDENAEKRNLTFYGHLVGFGLAVFAWSIIVTAFAVYCLASPSAAHLFSNSNGSSSSDLVADTLFYIAGGLLVAAALHLYLVKKLFLYYCQKIQIQRHRLDTRTFELTAMSLSSSSAPPQQVQSPRRIQEDAENRYSSDSATESASAASTRQNGTIYVFPI